MTLSRRHHALPLLLGSLLLSGVLHAQQAAAPPAAEAAAPATVLLVFHNEMGSAFGIKTVSWTVDKGEEQQMPDAAARANKDGDVVLLSGALPPGDHLVDITLLYKGTGYGVFSYLKGYQFRLTTKHLFQTAPGKEAVIRVVGFEKGNLTTEIKDRPAIRVDAGVRDVSGMASAEASRRQDEAARAAAKDIQLKTADEAYEVKMQALESGSRDLQGQIDRTKVKLAALQEALLSGNTAAGRAHIAYKNDMGASFRLRELHIFLDGAAIRDEVDETGDNIGKQERVELFDGNIMPGTHTLNINVVYQGVGYGVFSDINNSTFKLRSTHTFTVEKGKVLNLQIVAYEQGDSNTQLKDRPTIRFDAAVEAMQTMAPPPAVPAPAAAPVGTPPPG